MAKQCCEHDDGNCDHHEKKKNGVVDLADPVNTICVFVEGGVVQNVTGIPFGTKLMVVDYGTDGVDEQNLDLVKISEDEEPEQVNLSIYSHEVRDGMGQSAAQHDNRSGAIHYPLIGTIVALKRFLEDSMASNSHYPSGDGKVQRRDKRSSDNSVS